MKKIFSNILFNIQFEIDEIRYSTGAPIAFIALPIAIFAVGTVIYSLVSSFF